MQSLQPFLVWAGGGWMMGRLVFHGQNRVEMELWKLLSNLIMDIGLMMLMMSVRCFVLVPVLGVVAGLSPPWF